MMPRWEMHWRIDKTEKLVDDALSENEPHTGHDRGYSVHGPHVEKSFKVLSNGHILSANSQAGVMVTENPASPLYHAAWRSQDTTIKDADG